MLLFDDALLAFRFAISGVDHRLYYSSSSTDGFLGMILLRNAYIQQDTNKRSGMKLFTVAIDQHNCLCSGRDFCFVINAEGGQRQYYLVADSETEMHEWIKAIQEMIEFL